MARVKRRKLTAEQAALAGRVAAIRTRMGKPRKALSQPELHERLRRAYGERAPSLTTVKRWEQRGEILTTEDANMLAELAGCGLDWLLTGVGDPLEGPGMALGGPGSPPEPRSPAGGPEDWAQQAGLAVARTLRHALERGLELRKIAQYLLDLSTRGEPFGIEEIRDLVDLAQRYLWWDEQHPTGSKTPRPGPSPAPSDATNSTPGGKGSARS